MINSQGWLASAFDYIASLCQSVILTQEGQQLIKDKSRFISRKLQEAEKIGKNTYNTNIMRSLGFFKSPFQLYAVNTSSLKEKTITKVISGTSDPEARLPFASFGKMMGLQKNSPLSFFLRQDKDAYNDRMILANMMKPAKLHTMREKIAIKIAQWHREIVDKPIPCLFQSMHQFVMECIAEEILGLKELPKNAHEVIECAEYTISHEMEGFSILGRDIYLTESQQRFKNARDNFLKLAMKIVNDNAEVIQHGDGYLNKVLENIKRDDSMEEAFFKLENQQLLGSIATGLLLATGTLSVTLTFSLLHLDKAMLAVIQEKQMLNRDIEFIDHYFKEALRYAASGQTFRYASVPTELETENAEVITIPANTLLCLSARIAANNNRSWIKPGAFNPDRFDSEETPKIHTAKFAPFLLGPRMCPGRHIAEMIFKVVIDYFVKNNISIAASDEIKNVNNTDYWSTDDFTVRPLPGKLITAQLTQESNCKDISSNYKIGIGL